MAEQPVPNKTQDKKEMQQFVDGFRQSAPYINAFRGRTFVIAFGGEVVADEQFASLTHDIALLNSLGIRLILVHGARPQIEQRLNARDISFEYVDGRRITDDAALACVKEASGTVRLEIEALLSMGLANSPMAGARIRVASGNFVTARPLGIRDGIDHLHTGEVRRIDHEAINQQLNEGSIVLLSPTGYSPTGEIFNLTALEVATATCAAVKADKLICLVDAKGLLDSRKRLLRQLTLNDAEKLLNGKRKLPDEIVEPFSAAVQACRYGARRAHLINRHTDGALLQELFTRDGVGTLITKDDYEGMRAATIDDVGGILALIEPQESAGLLVRRSRENIEMEIASFIVVERDGMIIACAALHPFCDEAVGELACLVVHPDYQGMGYGDSLLNAIERSAVELSLSLLFTLTTRATHWFRERGFVTSDVKSLPVKRRELYNFQRNSKVLLKQLSR